MFVALLVAAGSAAGGAYLWFHESVAEVVASTPDVKVAAKRLDIALPGQPATALVVGYDKRAGELNKGHQSRSDTVMLVRADPETKSISLLSFPRDLFVEIHCPGKPTFSGRINGAYSECGTKGTLETVRKLTGLPINYLITVNFRGFRQLVDAVGGVWMDVDRRYFNDQGGDFGYATINLFPGYQKLGGYQALDYVRYRHTDSDLYRVARQQLFVRAFKDQIKANTGPLELPQDRQDDHEERRGRRQGGNKELDLKTVLSYALFAYSLPPGHFFQSKLEGLEETPASTSSCRRRTSGRRCRSSRTPTSSRRRRRRGRAEREAEAAADKAPPPRETTITVLNGNGVTGLGRHGQLPALAARLPDGLPARRQERERAELGLLQDADPLRQGAGRAPRRRRRRSRPSSAPTTSVPLDPKIAALSNGAMLTVIVGQTFHGTLAEAPVDKTPQRQPANVAPGADASLALLRERAPKVPFKVMVPTVIERSSWIDRERPVRMYRIDPDGKHKTIRLTYRHGRERVLGRADDRLGGRAGALRAQLHALDRRPALRAPLHRPEAAHGRAAAGRRDATGSSTRCSTRSRTRR